MKPKCTNCGSPSVKPNGWCHDCGLPVMDQDAQDSHDTAVVEGDMLARDKLERHIGRQLRQGLRHFQVGIKGPRGFVRSVNVRKRTVVLERSVTRRSKGKRKARKELEVRTVAWHKLRLCVPDRAQYQVEQNSSQSN